MFKKLRYSPNFLGDPSDEWISIRDDAMEMYQCWPRPKNL